jgi:predicted nucleotidyltransferase
MAIAMAENIIPWDHHFVGRMEHTLMTLDKPCAHALASLEALATARERRRGLRLENILRDALRLLADRIDIAFVFGSTARNRQTADSDIDLMVIGDVKLKDLSTPIRAAEKTLGRGISPVIYTREAFRQKYHTGDPFLIDVCRREKISLLGSGDHSSQEDLDHELRAMVAERLATT